MLRNLILKLLGLRRIQFGELELYVPIEVPEKAKSVLWTLEQTGYENTYAIGEYPLGADKASYFIAIQNKPFTQKQKDAINSSFFKD